MDFSTVRSAFTQAMGVSGNPTELWLLSLDDWRRFAAIAQLPWTLLRPMLTEGEGGWILRDV